MGVFITKQKPLTTEELGKKYGLSQEQMLVITDIMKTLTRKNHPAFRSNLPTNEMVIDTLRRNPDFLGKDDSPNALKWAIEGKTPEEAPKNYRIFEIISAFRERYALGDDATKLNESIKTALQKYNGNH